MKHRQCCLFTHSFLLFALILVAPGTTCARPKNDVLKMNNGDQITCEIMRLEKGYLYVRLDYGEGTVSLDWSRVSRVDSPQQFVFTDENRRRYTGTLQKFAVKAEQSEGQVAHKVNSAEVIEIERSDVGFWRNQHGSIDFGLNFAKQSNRTQYSLNAANTYNREEWFVGGNLTSSLATGGGSDLRNNLVLKGGYQLRSPRNLIIGYNEFLTEQRAGSGSAHNDWWRIGTFLAVRQRSAYFLALPDSCSIVSAIPPAAEQLRPGIAWRP
jgi:hypothetical protein